MSHSWCLLQHFRPISNYSSAFGRKMDVLAPEFSQFIPLSIGTTCADVFGFGGITWHIQRLRTGP